MNEKKLKQAEAAFLKRYPGGFAHPDFDAISKKHKPEKMSALAGTVFARESLADGALFREGLKGLIGKSSLVSVFEKVKFKDFIAGAAEETVSDLAGGYQGFLLGKGKKREEGFALLVETLAPDKMAKWTILTAPGAHLRPSVEALIKPNTVKGTIAAFELDVPPYKPAPSYQFYESYRQVILRMKEGIDPSLTGGNPEFQGFLMMALEDDSLWYGNEESF